MGHALHLTVPDGLPFIDFEREFDHPVAEVFRAHANPGLLGHVVHPSQEARDGTAASGMETGMSDGYERLEELLAARVR